MQRKPLLHILNRYREHYPPEDHMVTRICQLVERCPDCSLRTCRPGHITGSAWVLSHDRTQCLLVHHAKLERWLQPGGHADGQCDVSQVALREVQEETGLTELKLVEQNGELIPLDVDVHQIPARYDASGKLIEDAHEHHDIRFLVLADPRESLSISDESHDVRWFSREEVLQATDEESVLRMLHKAGPW